LADTVIGQRRARNTPHSLLDTGVSSLSEIMRLCRFQNNCDRYAENGLFFIQGRNIPL